jgi:hypothetical protein
VGWIPTGPCDYYHPWWGHRNSYNVVNVTNITNIRNVYNINSARAVGPLADSRRYPRISNVENVANDPRLQNGIVTTRTEDFGRGRGNARYRQGDGMDLKNAQLVAGTPPVVPTQDSLKASDQPARITAASARANATERYFTRNQPQAQPVSFQNQAAGVQQMVQTANPLNTPSRVESTERARARQVGGTAAGGSAETMNAPAASRTAAPASASPVSERGQSDRSNRGVGMVNSGNNPTAPAAPSAAPVAGSEKGRSGWSRAGDAAAGSAGSSQPAIQAAPPASGEAARRSGWTRFGEGRSTPPPPAAPSMAPPVNGGVSRRLDSHPSEAATPVSPATSRPSPADSRLGERFPVSRGSGVESRSSTAPASPAPERPQRFERAVPGDPPARVNSTPPSWGRERITSSRPEYPPSASRQETHSTPRSEAPVYQDRRQSSESPRVERPQLQIERPVVTERSAPRGYDGGSRAERQAPSSPPPQSSGRGDRGQSRR